MPIAAPSQIPDRTRYQTGRSMLFSQFTANNSPTRAVRRLMRELTHLTDLCVLEAWTHCIGTLPDSLRHSSSLIAIGGYGRAELLPNSDIDLLVLIKTDHLSVESKAQLSLAIEQWVSMLWDMGVTLSHSVRTIDECIADALEDLSIQTSILEGRYLAGDKKIHQIFYAAFNRHFDVPTFWREKMAEMRQRHAKFDDTPYSLEPNCKESPGGLRDLHLMLWLAKAANIGHTWQELHHNNWLTASQLRLIQRSENQLLAIRAHLHILSKRMENRVLFDLQTPLAHAFGLFETDGKRAGEHLMQRYYLAARAIYQQCTLFVQKFELFLSPPSAPHIAHKIKGFPDFVEVDHVLDVVKNDAFIRKPHLLIDVFYVYGQVTGLTGFSPKLWDAILQARNLITPEFRRNPENRSKFIRLLKLDNGITHAIRLMNQTGVLGRYIPAFRRIIGQMQHDLFHIYTVDQHILTVVRNLRRFTLQEHMQSHFLANQVMAEFGQPWLLYIAGLFHDIAKGRGGDHSDLGAVEVARFAKQHALTKKQTALVVFLVKQHLTMSTFAQKEDLSDMETIQRFAKTVKSVENLQALYLLTVADIRGTSPKVWNAWKDKLLADLYQLTLRELSGQTQAPVSMLKERTMDALELLPSAEIQAQAQALWNDFDSEYFMRHDATTIAWHAEHIVQHPKNTGTSAIVATKPFNNDHSLHVMVYTPDVPDLFARLCSFFQQRYLSIFDAQIYTSGQGIALDTFQVLLPESHQADALFVQRLNQELRETLTTAPALRAPNLGRLTARSRNFPIVPRVSLTPTDKGEYVLKLAATDRHGVLYSIAYILKQMNIRLRSARIVTLGERLEDVFILSSDQLNDPSAAAQLEAELMRVCTIS